MFGFRLAKAGAKMKNELIKLGHAVGESNFHLQLTPVYRWDVFRDEQVAELTLAYILGSCMN